MSFWGFGGGGGVDDLPSAEASAPHSKVEEDKPQKVPPVTAGPPPVENTYNHAIQRPTIPIDEQHSSPPAANPPGFQIFIPKVEDSKTAIEENDDFAIGDKSSSETGNTLEDATARDGDGESKDGVESCSEKRNGTSEVFGHVDAAKSEAENTSEQEAHIEAETMNLKESSKSTTPGDEVISNAEKTFENQREDNSHSNEKTEEGDKIMDDNIQCGTVYKSTIEEAENPVKLNTLQQAKDSTASPKTLAKIVSPLKQNRFNFLTQVPIAIPKLHENKTRRRYEYRCQVHEMDCRLAGLQANVAKESMDRDIELRNILPSVCRRVENISDQFMGSKFMMDDERTQILNVQKRLADAHTRTLQYKHETLNQIQFDEFESIYVDLIENIKPSIKIEASKTDKREVALFRKFESLAGTHMRRFVEESSTRVAAGKLLEEQMKIEEPEGKTGFLEQIRQLRRKLKEERKSRQVYDTKVLKDVHERCAALQRAVLEAAGDQL